MVIGSLGTIEDLSSFRVFRDRMDMHIREELWVGRFIKVDEEAFKPVDRALFKLYLYLFKRVRTNRETELARSIIKKYINIIGEYFEEPRDKKTSRYFLKGLYRSIVESKHNQITKKSRFKFTEDERELIRKEPIK